jgi:hypothetical protein
LRIRGILHEAAIFLLFFLLSVALTWPLARNLRTAVSDLGDPLLNAFIVDWDIYALTHEPLHLFDAPFYAPGKYPLAYSENMTAIAVLMLPFHFLGAAPITLYNIAFLLGFALSGYGAYVLARVCGRSVFASIIGGIFFAFCSFKFDHLAHLQIIWSGWLPLMFAALFAYWRAPSAKRAALLGIAFTMNGLTNIHWLLFGSFTLAATVALLAIIEPRDRKTWLRLVASLAIGSAVLLPFLIPYRIVSKAYGMRRAAEEVMAYSATLDDWLVATPPSLLYGQLAAHSEGERKLFPGALPIALFIAALLLTRRRDGGQAPSPVREGQARAPVLLIHLLDAAIVVFAVATYIGAVSQQFEIKAFHHRFISINNAGSPGFLLIVAILLRLLIRLPPALGGPARKLRDLFTQSRFTPEEWAGLMWIAIGVFGSLGLHGVLHGFLFRHVEAFRSLRVPARWAIIAYAGLVIWSSLGVDLLLRRAGAPTRRGYRWSAAAAAIAILALLDVTARVRWEQAVTEPPPVYRWLRTAPVRGLVLELPMSGWIIPLPYILGSTAHHVPIMNGYSGFEPPVHQELRDMTERGEMNDVFLNNLERRHCELLIVHADWLGRQRKATMQWLANEVAGGRLAFVRRFDHWTEGDWVFALTHASADWQRFRGPQTVDGAGLTPDQEAERFLRGESTYNASTFFIVDTPKQDEEHHGPLRVAGWALSPDGIKRVRVLVNGGEKSYDASFVDRGDVSGRWPWYRKTTRPGFVVVLPKRPKGVRRETDVQLEFTDGAGRVTRSLDITTTWD